MTPFPRVAFKALVASILNCHPTYVTWKGDAEPSYGKPAAPFLWGSCRIGSSSRVMVGADDLRQTDNVDGTYSLNETGRRNIILGFDIFTYDSTAIHFADDLADLLLTRLWSPINLDLLNGMALVLETCGAILPIPTYVNQRFISAAHVDVTVALANQDAALAPGGMQTIGEVFGTGTLTKESGSGTTTQVLDVKENVHP